VEVKDAAGNILFSRVMHSGDSWPVPDMPGLTMTAGNAGGTEIADKGTAGQPLGTAGAVIRNYALTPADAASATAAGASPAPTVNASQNAVKGTN
jgi:cytoskeleton protein RodZ